MATQVTIRTVDGRIIHGINYTVGSLPSDPTLLAAGMPGGMNYGVYHIHDENGWVYIPANQIQQITKVQLGVPT